MKIFKLFFKIGCLSLTASLLSACVSTETIEDPSSKNEQTSNELSIQLSAPESVGTRAGNDDFMLRYSAMLYEMNNTSLGELVKRQEITQTSSNPSPTLKFSVSPGKYRIYIFADYIPGNSDANSNGLYNDYYYDTQNMAKLNISLKGYNGETLTQITKDFFNNPNYECFYHVEDINKTEKRYDIDQKLKRAVAKVRFYDENITDDNFDEITFSNFSTVPIFFMANKIGSTSMTQRQLSNINLTELTTDSYDNKKVLFYFYTFESSNDKKLGEYNLTVKNKSGVSNQVSINTGKITAVANYVTTVKGSFISLLSPDDGDINVKLDTDLNWGNGIDNSEVTINPFQNN